MEVQPITPTADTGAAATPAPAQPFDPGSVSESEYAHARTNYEKEHGPGSWLNRDFTAPTEQKPKNDPAPKPQGDSGTGAGAGRADEGGDLEPGEVTINADGKAIDSKTGRFVPKSAFLRVKGELGAVKSEKDTLATELVKARERLSIFTETTQQPAAQQQKVEPPKPVDPKEDIFGAFNYLQHQYSELQKQLENANKGVTEAQQTIERNAVQSYAKSDADAFAAKTADFKDALAHVSTVIEKAAMRAGADAEGARQAVLQQIGAIINTSRSTGKSWASEVYEWAKEIGYQAKVNGETEAQRKAREDIERINAGGAAGHSLRGAGGGAVGEQLTAAKLAGMSEGEYFTTRKNYIAKHGLAAWEKLVNS
jgi:uncharacterized protein (DUF2147 family)